MTPIFYFDTPLINLNMLFQLPLNCYVIVIQNILLNLLYILKHKFLNCDLKHNLSIVGHSIQAYLSSDVFFQYFYKKICLIENYKDQLVLQNNH